MINAFFARLYTCIVLYHVHPQLTISIQLHVRCTFSFYLERSLSGLSPFMGGTDVETMANVTIGKYDFDDEAFAAVSKEALDFIGKLLVKDSR